MTDPEAYEYAKKLFETKPIVNDDDTKMQLYKEAFNNDNKNEKEKHEEEQESLRKVSIKLRNLWLNNVNLNWPL